MVKKHTQYSIDEGIRFRRKGGIASLFLAAALFASGLYLLVLTFAPAVNVPGITQPTVTATENDTNRVVIEKIGVDIPFHTGGAEALEKGAWHRFPERGDPEKGGNFIVSAHRFELGLTPQQTRARSPFYSLDKLEIGDKITVKFNNLTYTYQIEQKYDVERTAVEIEAPSEAHKLTMYSCSLKGEKDGRIVIEAKQI
jgi:sortase A